MHTEKLTNKILTSKISDFSSLKTLAGNFNQSLGTQEFKKTEI